MKTGITKTLRELQVGWEWEKILATSTTVRGLMPSMKDSIYRSLDSAVEEWKAKNAEMARH